MANETVIGTETLAKNIALYTERFLQEVNVDMEKSELILKSKIKENISNTDYTLADLRRMGHPYARKNPNPPHTPEYIVHRQSGKMLQGLKSGTVKANVTSGKLEAEAFAGIDDSVDHAKYVVFGTSKMIPRDFLRGSLGEVSEKILSTLKNSLRSATINFNGKKVKL